MIKSFSVIFKKKLSLFVYLRTIRFDVCGIKYFLINANASNTTNSLNLNGWKYSALYVYHSAAQKSCSKIFFTMSETQRV